jgi:hypothetical protein
VLYVASVAVQGFDSQVLLLDAAQLEAALLGGMPGRHVQRSLTV